MVEVEKNIKIPINVDGKELKAMPMTNLRSLLISNGIKEHGICHHEKMISPGKCDLCLVKIGESVLRSCEVFITTPLNIETSTDDLIQNKMNSYEMLANKHQTDCERCHQSGVCKLQDLARSSTQPQSETQVQRIHDQKEELARDYHLNHARCISCSLCVDYSQKVEKDGLFRKKSRGKYTRVAFESSKLKNVDLSLYRDLCPSGAIAHKNDYRLGAKSSWASVTCPGCERQCELHARTIDKRFIDISSKEIGYGCEAGFDWWKSQDLWRIRPDGQQNTDQLLQAKGLNWKLYLAPDLSQVESDKWLELIKRYELVTRILVPDESYFAHPLGPDGAVTSPRKSLNHLEVLKDSNELSGNIIIVEPIWGYTDDFYHELKRQCEHLVVVSYQGIDSEKISLQVERNTWMNSEFLVTKQSDRLEHIIDSLMSRNS